MSDRTRGVATRRVLEAPTNDSCKQPSLAPIPPSRQEPQRPTPRGIQSQLDSPPPEVPSGLPVEHF